MVEWNKTKSEYIETIAVDKKDLAALSRNYKLLLEARKYECGEALATKTLLDYLNQLIEKYKDQIK